jgi:hypothetical protein
VPITAFTAATNREAPRLSCSADIACGVVTEAQNPSHPSFVERKTTAPSGMSTITLR